MNPGTKNGSSNGKSGSCGGSSVRLPNSLLHFEHIERRMSDAFNLDTRVLEQLEKYTLYYKELKGYAPPKDEVVEQALIYVFKLDVGFRRFLATGTAAVQTTPMNGRKGKADANSSHEQSESAPDAEGAGSGKTAATLTKT